MKEKTHGNNGDALNAGIAKSREEIAALAADLKKLSEWKNDESPVEEEQPHKDSANVDNRHSGWTGFRHRLGKAGARSEKIAKGLGDEIERHPMIGGMAAFGLGLVIAGLLFRRNKKNTKQ